MFSIKLVSIGKCDEICNETWQRKKIKRFSKQNSQRPWKTKTFITKNVGLQKTITSKSKTLETAEFVYFAFYIALFSNESH